MNTLCSKFNKHKLFKGAAQNIIHAKLIMKN